MTPDEHTLLSNFLRDLQTARASGKDAEAEVMIREAFATNPDAAYLIVQHAILSDQALHAAQGRIAELEGGRNPGGSFLGGRPQPQYPPATSVPVSQPYSPFSSPFSQSPFSSGGGLGSFLRNAGTMAAGVAAGDLLFEGLSGLFGGHRGFGLGGFGGGWGGGYGPTVENVTVNEYGDRGGDFDNASYDGGSDDGGGGWDNS
jgi:hypothetical protein